MTHHRPTEKQIAERAYQIWLERGCEPGHDVDDWLQAEYELTQLPVRKLAEMTLAQPAGRKPKRKSLLDVIRAALF